MDKMLGIYKTFWVHGMDHTSKTSRNDFWIALWWNVIVYILILAYIMAYKQRTDAIFGIFVFVAYTLALIAPAINLMMRRYNDLGLSKYWLIITLLLPIALLIVNALEMHALSVEIMAWILLGIHFIICMFPKNAFSHQA